MPKVLSEEQIAFYRDNGYLAPFDGVDTADAAAMCEDLHAFERDEGFGRRKLSSKGICVFAGPTNFPAIQRCLMSWKI